MSKLLARLRDERRLIIISAQLANSLTRPWRCAISPFGLVAMTLFSVTVIALQSESAWQIFPQLSSLTASEFAIAIAIVILLLLAHELAHVAAALNVPRASGDVILLLRYLIVPTATARITTPGTTTKVEKCAISLAGPVLQAFLSSFLLATSNYQAFAVAAKFSLLASVLNLMPLLKLDGYWVACDIVGSRLTFVLNFRTECFADLIYTLTVGVMAIIGGALAFFLFCF